MNGPGAPAVAVLAWLCAAVCSCAGSGPFEARPRRDPPSARVSAEGEGPGAAGLSLFDPPWDWRDDHDRPVTLSSYQGKTTLLTMFFMSCSSRCPMTVSKLQSLADAFVREHLDVQVILVTLDPRNDTPLRLGDFKRAAHLRDDMWHLLAGSPGETRALGRRLGVRPSYDDSHIDHDVKIAILDGDGRVLRTFDGWHFDDDVAIAAAREAPTAAPKKGRGPIRPAPERPKDAAESSMEK